jgi:hypothetical protein
VNNDQLPDEFTPDAATDYAEEDGTRYFVALSADDDAGVSVWQVRTMRGDDERVLHTGEDDRAAAQLWLDEYIREHDIRARWAAPEGFAAVYQRDDLQALRLQRQVKQMYSKDRWYICFAPTRDLSWHTYPTREAAQSALDAWAVENDIEPCSYRRITPGEQADK